MLIFKVLFELKLLFELFEEKFNKLPEILIKQFMEDKSEAVKFIDKSRDRMEELFELLPELFELYNILLDVIFIVILFAPE